MIDCPVIQILMATYNGEKYIRRQIDSIVDQKYTKWNLLVRDDGSQDGTVSILDEYSARDHRIRYVVNKTERHGWKQNFQCLLQLSWGGKEPYFMFSDQDDIWMPNKLESLLQVMIELEGRNPGKPILVYGDMQIIDDNDVIKQYSFNSLYNIRVKHPTDCFFSQRILGCNMMFNNKLMEDVCRTIGEDVYENLSHDGLVAKVAAAKDGIVHYMDETFMQYRRHENNATGREEFAISAVRAIQRLRKFKRLALDQKSTYVQSIQVVELLDKQKLAGAQKRKLQEIRMGIEKGGFCLIYTWLKYRVNCGSPLRTVSHFLVLLSGMWKE